MIERTSLIDSTSHGVYLSPKDSQVQEKRKYYFKGNNAFEQSNSGNKKEGLYENSTPKLLKNVGHKKNPKGIFSVRNSSDSKLCDNNAGSVYFNNTDGFSSLNILGNFHRTTTNQFFGETKKLNIEEFQNILNDFIYSTEFPELQYLRMALSRLTQLIQELSMKYTNVSRELEQSKQMIKCYQVSLKQKERMVSEIIIQSKQKEEESSILSQEKDARIKEIEDYFQKENLTKTDERRLKFRIGEHQKTETGDDQEKSKISLSSNIKESPSPMENSSSKYEKESFQQKSVAQRKSAQLMSSDLKSLELRQSSSININFQQNFAGMFQGDETPKYNRKMSKEIYDFKSVINLNTQKNNSSPYFSENSNTDKIQQVAHIHKGKYGVPDYDQYQFNKHVTDYGFINQVLDLEASKNYNPIFNFQIQNQKQKADEEVKQVFSQNQELLLLWKISKDKESISDFIQNLDDNSLDYFLQCIRTVMNNTDHLVKVIQQFQKIIKIFKQLDSSLSMEETLAEIIKNTCKILDCQRASVFLVDHKKKQLWTKVAQGADTTIRVPIDTGFVGHVFKHRETLNILDAQVDNRFNASIDELTHFKTKTVLTSPIFNQNQKFIIGIIQAINQQSPINQQEKSIFFTRDDEGFLEIMGSLLEKTFNNTLNIDEQISVHNCLRNLFSASIRLNSCYSLKQFLMMSQYQLLNCFDIHKGFVYAYNKDTDTLFRYDDKGQRKEYKSQVGITGLAFTRGIMSEINNGYEHWDFIDGIDLKTNLPVIYVPIYSPDDTSYSDYTRVKLGILVAENSQGLENLLEIPDEMTKIQDQIKPHVQKDLLKNYCELISRNLYQKQRFTDKEEALSQSSSKEITANSDSSKENFIDTLTPMPIFVPNFLPNKIENPKYRRIDQNREQLTTQHLSCNLTHHGYPSSVQGGTFEESIQSQRGQLSHFQSSSISSLSFIDRGPFTNHNKLSGNKYFDSSYQPTPQELVQVLQEIIQNNTAPQIEKLKAIALKIITTLEDLNSQCQSLTRELEKSRQLLQCYQLSLKQKDTMLSQIIINNQQKDDLENYLIDEHYQLINQEIIQQRAVEKQQEIFKQNDYEKDKEKDQEQEQELEKDQVVEQDQESRRINFAISSSNTDADEEEINIEIKTNQDKLKTQNSQNFSEFGKSPRNLQQSQLQQIDLQNSINMIDLESQEIRTRTNCNNTPRSTFFNDSNQQIKKSPFIITKDQKDQQSPKLSPKQQSLIKPVLSQQEKQKVISLHKGKYGIPNYDQYKFSQHSNEYGLINQILDLDASQEEIMQLFSENQELLLLWKLTKDRETLQTYIQQDEHNLDFLLDSLRLVVKNSDHFVKVILQLKQIIKIFQNLDSTYSMEEALTTIIKTTCQIMDCERASVFLVDHQKQELWTQVAKGANTMIRVPINTGFVGHVYRSKETLNVLDAQVDNRFNSTIDKLTNFHTQTVLTAPIFDQNRKYIIGIIQAINQKSPLNSEQKAIFFTKDDEGILEILGSLLQKILSNSLNVDEQTSIQNTLRGLLSAGLKLNMTQTMMEFLIKAEYELQSCFDVHQGYIYAYDSQEKKLYRFDEKGVQHQYSCSIGITGSAFINGSVKEISNSYLHQDYIDGIDLQTNLPVIMIPLYNPFVDDLDQPEKLGIIVSENAKGIENLINNPQVIENPGQHKIEIQQDLLNKYATLVAQNIQLRSSQES